mmetsp:Transcript_23158/g.54153  ORF Transcript_23158/g.54153 Transcript_23158/m.54153 type:complete len:232 (-) Transcript_23158:306-1001(-)
MASRSQILGIPVSLNRFPTFSRTGCLHVQLRVTTAVESGGTSPNTVLFREVPMEATADTDLAIWETVNLRERRYQAGGGMGRRFQDDMERQKGRENCCACPVKRCQGDRKVGEALSLFRTAAALERRDRGNAAQGTTWAKMPKGQVFSDSQRRPGVGGARASVALVFVGKPATLVPGSLCQAAVWDLRLRDSSTVVGPFETAALAEHPSQILGHGCPETMDSALATHGATV